MTAPVSETANDAADAAAPAKSERDRVIVFDTTMRDGEQSPGASMSLEEKIELAKILEEMKVDVIEAGFPIASNGDFEAVRQIAELVTESTVCGLARAGMADIERCAEAIRKAKRGRIHTFLSTSPSHRDHILHASQEDILEMITKSVGHARNLCDDGDGFLTGKKYLIHDRDPLFTTAFLATLAASGVKSVKLPPRSPNLNGYPLRTRNFLCQLHGYSPIGERRRDGSNA